jgi:hypothetical protein
MQGRRVFALVGISVSLVLLGGKGRLTPVVAAAAYASNSTGAFGQPTSCPSPSPDCISVYHNSAILKRNKWETHRVIQVGETLTWNFNSSSKSFTIHFNRNPCKASSTSIQNYYPSDSGTVTCILRVKGTFHYEVISPSPNIAKKVKKGNGPVTDRVTPCKGCYLEVVDKNNTKSQ